MTDQTWNIETIEKEFRATHTISNASIVNERWECIKARLTTHNPVFKENEIVVVTAGGAVGGVTRATGEIKYDVNIRRPTPSEVPPWEKDKKALALAMERLERISSGEHFQSELSEHTGSTWLNVELVSIKSYAQTALDDIRELI